MCCSVLQCTLCGSVLQGVAVRVVNILTSQRYHIKICHIKMLFRLRSRSLHFLCTCEKKNAAQRQLPKKTCFARMKNRNSALRSGFLFTSTQTVHRPRSQSPQHCDNWNIQQIRSKNKYLALCVYFPQPCSSAGSRFAA